jgi:hypothetical protein
MRDHELPHTLANVTMQIHTTATAPYAHITHMLSQSNAMVQRACDGKRALTALLPSRCMRADTTTPKDRSMPTQKPNDR